jgi:hypothetical protein
MLLTDGFAQAYERFQSAQARGDSGASFHALFEALNWAHAIDDHIALTWSYQGQLQDYGWRSNALFGRGDALALVMDGLRYVRNRVHHQWADALIGRDGVQLPFKLPRVLITWVWRSIDELPSPPKGREDERGRAAYTAALADLAAQETLSTMSTAFGFVGMLLTESSLRKRRRWLKW